jgi:transglutaminase-like putative cysteine protease
MARVTTKGRHRTHGPLPLGDHGVDVTVTEHMTRLAVRDMTSREIVTIAGRIDAKCPAFGTRAGDECRLWAAFKAVVDTVTYVNDPDTAEHITAPKFLMTTHPEGDCDCMSTALASILMALGYPVRFKTIAWRGDDFSHVYLEVHVPSRFMWIPLDPVYQMPGDRYHGFGQEKAPVLRAKLYPINTLTA